MPPLEPQKPTEEKSATESKSSSESAKQENPVKPTPSSIASGKKSYTYDCAMCHGKEGAGDGDLAGDMHLKLRDYRDPATLKELTDGEIYSIIARGKGKMTEEDGRMKPEQIWDMVNCIRSLAKNKLGENAVHECWQKSGTSLSVNGHAVRLATQRRSRRSTSMESFLP
jgi:mono/diheme cytochrome c family protein